MARPTNPDTDAALEILLAIRRSDETFTAREISEITDIDIGSLCRDERNALAKLRRGLAASIRADVAAGKCTAQTAAETLALLPR
jgi:hypothetical protein